MENPSKRTSPDRSAIAYDGVEAALRDMFHEAATQLDAEQPIAMEDLPRTLRVAIRRFADHLRASNAEPEEMLRRIKLLLGSARRSAHRENERKLADAVVSFAIRSYFSPDNHDGIPAQ